MSKYGPIRDFLEANGSETVALTFAEVEAILQFKLPPSHRHRAWWSNSRPNNAMTNEWLVAGYKAEQVDIIGQKLVFRRTTPTISRKKPKRPVERTRPGGDRIRHPAMGAMKDVTWIAPGVDLTEPADPGWADLIDDPDWGKLPE